jgi:hypothetical protein
MATDSERRFLRKDTQLLIEGDKSMAINGDLIFENVEGPWQGNDFEKVSMVSVTFNGVLHAFVFLTHMNVDFGGAPNAYGPPDKNPLDTLDHAGQNSHYYGLVSTKPDATRDVFVPGQGKQKKTLVELYNLKLDPLHPDKQGYLPVAQQSGEYDGYYISITSRATRSLAGATSFSNRPISTRLKYLSVLSQDGCRAKASPSETTEWQSGTTTANTPDL